MTARQNWPAGVVACAVLFALLALVDDQPTEAQAVAEDVTVAHKRARIQSDMDALAQRICNAELGPGTRVVWTVDGDLVCRPGTHTAEGSTP